MTDFEVIQNFYDLGFFLRISDIAFLVYFHFFSDDKLKTSTFTISIKFGWINTKN